MSEEGRSGTCMDPKLSWRYCSPRYPTQICSSSKLVSWSQLLAGTPLDSVTVAVHCSVSALT